MGRVCRNVAKFGQHPNWPHWAEIGPNLSDFGHSAKFGQIWPSKLARFSPHLPNLAQVWANLANFVQNRQNIRQIAKPNSDNLGPILGQIGPNFDLTSARLGGVSPHADAHTCWPIWATSPGPGHGSVAMVRRSPTAQTLASVGGLDFPHDFRARCLDFRAHMTARRRWTLCRLQPLIAHGDSR